jgi:hypothetical protein
MAGLPHYTSAKASINKFEPVFTNQYEVMILPPTAVVVPQGNPNNGNILLEHVKSIEGLAVDQNPGEVTQMYKNAKRYYSGAKPQRTNLDLGINFEVNLDSNNSMYVFKIMRQWADLIYNPLTGAMGLKKDYCGTILISVFNKAGDVFRRITCKDCFIMTPLSAMDLNYTGTNIFSLRVQWAVDYFDDVFI